MVKYINKPYIPIEKKTNPYCTGRKIGQKIAPVKKLLKIQSPLENYTELSSYAHWGRYFNFERVAH